MLQKGNATGFGVGILTGTAIGVAIGMLNAPHSGKQNRAILKDKVRKAEDKAEEILDEARQRADRIVDKAKGKAAELSKES